MTENKTPSAQMRSAEESVFKTGGTFLFNRDFNELVAPLKEEALRELASDFHRPPVILDALINGVRDIQFAQLVRDERPEKQAAADKTPSAKMRSKYDWADEWVNCDANDKSMSDFHKAS